MGLTSEHYRIALQNGISRKTAYHRHKLMLWDIEQAITTPSRVYKTQGKLTEYGVYKGENLLCFGTAKECAEHLGILETSFRYYLTVAYQRRVAKRKKDYGNRLTIVKLDDEDEE